MHRTRSSVLVDQSVSSKARRAASIAAAHVVGVGVGGDAEHLLGGRVDRGKRARAAGDELAVDEQSLSRSASNRHPELPCLILDNCPTEFRFEP